MGSFADRVSRGSLVGFLPLARTAWRALGGRAGATWKSATQAQGRRLGRARNYRAPPCKFWPSCITSGAPGRCRRRRAEGTRTVELVAYLGVPIQREKPEKYDGPTRR